MATRQLIQQRVDGLEESRRALERVLNAERAGAVEALPLIGQEGVRRIRIHAPLDTGRLRRSYGYEVGPDYVDISSNVHYAPYQEFGTRFQNGTPHVRPAMEELRGEIPALVAAAAGRAGIAAGQGLGGLVRRTIGRLT